MTQRNKLLEWCLDNESAADFLEMMISVSQCADDLADNDKIINRGDTVVLVLHNCLVDLLNNAFYRPYADWLRPIISSVIIMWGGSNVWESSKYPIDKHWAYVYRDGIEMLVHQVALLLGGLEHAQNVALDCHEFFAIQDPETYAEWLEAQPSAESYQA